MLNSFVIKTFAVFAFLLTLSSPAWAGTSDRVSFDIKPRVISKLLNQAQGETKLLVASNAPFEINVSGIVGPITVTIEKGGNINGTVYGASAQFPGQETQITFVTTDLETSIYQADRKTALKPGKPIDQAVLVKITYDGASHPNIVLEPVQSDMIS